MPIEHTIDALSGGRATLIDATPGGIPPDQIMRAMRDQHPLIAQMASWTNSTRPAHRSGGLLDRDRYVSPDTTTGKIHTARLAAKDDAVGGVLDATESLALKRVSFTARDPAEQDMWNQWAGVVNLDAKLRAAWRVLAVDSQFVMALWWGRRTFRVRGTTEAGNARRKVFADLRVPTALSLLDSLKVVPVGSTLFDQERLAYVADREEAARFDEILGEPGVMPGIGFPRRTATPPSDPLVERLLTGRYRPSKAEAKKLRDHGVDPTHLFLMRPGTVFRHTLTRPDYEPFADVRMDSVSELLDIKHQLRQMDRAFLVGGTNFIVLIKVGSDKQPGMPEEIDYMSARVQTIAQVPLIVGDHRLNVEIITPKLDSVLNRERYDTIDVRIVARLYRMFLPTGAGADNIAQVSKLVGTNLQNDRHMLLRSLERNIFNAVLDANPDLVSRPKLRFHPGRIALEFDAAWASFLLDLRESREISRDTIHSQFELDQDDEAFMLEREADLYDDIFRTFVPHGANPNGTRTAPAAPDGVGDDGGGSAPSGGTGRAAQRRAGRRAGRRQGGAAPGTGQGEAPRRPRRRSDGGRSQFQRADDEDGPEFTSRTAAYARAQELGIPGRSRMGLDELVEAIVAAEAGQDSDEYDEHEHEHDEHEHDERDRGEIE